MTFSNKKVAFALLASVAFAAHADHSKPCRKSVDCPKSDHIDRSFSACLTFAQELVENDAPAPSPGQPGNSAFKPRSENDIPQASGKEVTGHIDVCFSKDLSEMHYKLFVFNAEGNENSNERITQAHLHVGRASENGPIVAFLFNATDNPADFDCGQAINGCLVEGTLTNRDIKNIKMGDTQEDGPQFNTVASLFDAVRRGEIYVNVHGSDTCNDGGIGYASGIVRGQLFTEQTSG